MLIEKYNGAFPMWLAPEQVRVLSLTDRTAENAKATAAELKRCGFRAEADVRSEKLGKKIREAQLDKVPYALVIGGHRAEGDLGTMTLDQFAALAKEEVDSKVRK